ncbi:hypothetical protein RRG08_032661 [Elysia crispata]|uniref:Uncharacterized protein n=1 Tax=Elysia crispata TaxID=231223 RepID=A0AAE0XZQ9_9GAST|nr:hypothetical protein RRG08_032661 [Elysia crispata]
MQDNWTRRLYTGSSHGSHQATRVIVEIKVEKVTTHFTYSVRFTQVGFPVDPGLDPDLELNLGLPRTRRPSKIHGTGTPQSGERHDLPSSSCGETPEDARVAFAAQAAAPLVPVSPSQVRKPDRPSINYTLVQRFSTCVSLTPLISTCRRSCDRDDTYNKGDTTFWGYNRGHPNPQPPFLLSPCSNFHALAEYPSLHRTKGVSLTILGVDIGLTILDTGNIISANLVADLCRGCGHSGKQRGFSRCEDKKKTKNTQRFYSPRHLAGGRVHQPPRAPEDGLKRDSPALKSTDQKIKKVDCKEARSRLSEWLIHIEKGRNVKY